jgi:hypothetical protein
MRWADNTRIIHWQRASAQPSQLRQAYAFGSGREALLAWLLAQPGGPPHALLPAWLPQGIYLPFQRAGARISFYNLDAAGDPCWDEVAELGQSVQVAVIIHFFGLPRQAQRFRHCLPPDALLIEDWAHTYPGAAEPNGGDWMLYSANKLVAAPDGAWMLPVSGRGQPPMPPAAGHRPKRLLYLFLRLLYLALATLAQLAPALNPRRILKRLASRAYRWSYRLLLAYSAQPTGLSGIGQWLWRHSPHQDLMQRRHNQWAQYAAGIRAAAALHPICDKPQTAYPPIGFPLWVNHRERFHLYLMAHGIEGAVYTDGWWFAPPSDESRLAPSRRLWERHYLLPINPALSPADIERIIHTVNAFH